MKSQAALHPDQAETNLQLGRFDLAHHEAEKALPYLTRAFDRNRTNAAALQALATAYLQVGDTSRALSLLHSVPPSQQDAAMHPALAHAEDTAGLFAQAAQDYRRADALRPAEASTFGAGYELILAGSVAESLALFQAGVQRYPQSIDLRVGLGAAHLLLGRIEAGHNTLLAVADQQPEDPRPYPFLAAAALSAGPDRERILHSFERYASVKPDSSDATYFYALALSRDSSADPQKVVVLLQRSLQLRPALQRPPASRKH